MHLKHIGSRYTELIAPKVGVLINGIKSFPAFCILWGILQFTSQNTYGNLRERRTKYIELKSKERKRQAFRKNRMFNPKKIKKKEMKKQKMGQLENNGKIVDLNPTK